MNLFTNDRYGLNITKVLCKRCGLMFTNPMLTQNSADFFYKTNLYRDILHPAGVIDNSKDDYIKTALDKINNYKDLIKLKANLRNKIEASPIFDSDTFARNFEDLLLKIHN